MVCIKHDKSFYVTETNHKPMEKERSCLKVWSYYMKILGLNFSKYKKVLVKDLIKILPRWYTEYSNGIVQKRLESI